MKVALNVQGVGVIRGWLGESLTSGATIREPSLSTSTAANALSGASSWPSALHSAVVPSPEGNEPPSRGCPFGFYLLRGVIRYTAKRAPCPVPSCATSKNQSQDRTSLAPRRWVRRLRQAAGQADEAIAARVEAILPSAPSAQPRIPGSLPSITPASPLGPRGGAGVLRLKLHVLPDCAAQGDRV